MLIGIITLPQFEHTILKIDRQPSLKQSVKLYVTLHYITYWQWLVLFEGSIVL